MDATNSTTKRCSKGDECAHPQGPILPATSKYFYRDKNKPDLMRAECKACTTRMLGVRPSSQSIIYEIPDGHIRCRNGDKCLTPGGPILPATKDYFWTDSGKNRTICKKCHRQSVQQWQQDHPERTKELANKSQRRSRRLHPERERSRRHKREARQRELPATFTATDWKFALDYFHGACAYCGHGPSLFDVNWTLHQEHHIPLARGGGYTPQNIVPACQSCNMDKSDKEPHDWLIIRFGKRKGSEINEKLQVFFAAARQDNPISYTPQSAEEKRELGRQRQREISHAQAQARRAAVVANPPTHKTCASKNKCAHPDGPLLPFSSEYFSRNSSHVDGLDTYCKKCVRKRSQERKYWLNRKSRAKSR